MISTTKSKPNQQYTDHIQTRYILEPYSIWSIQLLAMTFDNIDVILSRKLHNKVTKKYKTKHEGIPDHMNQASWGSSKGFLAKSAWDNFSLLNADNSISRCNKSRFRLWMPCRISYKINLLWNDQIKYLLASPNWPWLINRRRGYFSIEILPPH